MFRQKIRFFFWHLLLSVVIVSGLSAWLFLVWYPTPLARATGMYDVFYMVALIDIVIGPLLGFVVYNESKASLKFDLAFIFCLQIAALCYGTYSLAQGRPVWLAYNVDRFELIRANEIVLNNKIQSSSPYQQTSWLHPRFVGVQIAEDIDEKNKNLFEEVLAGISIAQRPERYVELTQVKDQIQQRAQDLTQLKQFNKSSVVESTLVKYPQATAWVPLKANTVDMVVLINKEKAEIIKIVDLRPWN
ncbi:type IV pilin accessory protein [Acinetobacter schindleri]|uniref:TfpX/TfpZ family type IV pilin accessory protein n=1 Tax=Acinetobacter schindleri TaxID=108981 RepID=UPI0013B07833|nr:TfpX/TfpZ family type IV pilin accessory protein [Acinetobacter schindleri]QIC61478.1 type IV pilin accessory protein [Acinetobacter schindleri]